jgi:hypothetical protein
MTYTDLFSRVGNIYDRLARIEIKDANSHEFKTLEERIYPALTRLAQAFNLQAGGQYMHLRLEQIEAMLERTEQALGISKAE